MLTKELKQNWVDALESGKYIRGIHSLHTNNKHCCLGVLVDIHPDLQIDDNGSGCVDNGVKCGYGPLQVLLGVGPSSNLAVVNDSIPEDDPTYEIVLPIIKDLPTSD